MSGEFRHDIRVLACNGCGAPFEIPAEGGSARCRYCGADATADAREEIDLAAAGATVADETIRLEILHLQDPKAGSTAIQSVAEQNEELALDLWQKARADLRTHYSTEGETTLFQRTQELASLYGSRGELYRGRAVVETALELSRSRRFTQCLRGWMSRMATAGGDVASAWEWLAKCDPRSEDLHMDTAYRFSCAAALGHKGDQSGVLAQLGDAFGRVPVQNAFDSIAAFYRANALEALRGGSEGAAELHRAADAHPLGWERIAELHRLHPRLCVESVRLAPRVFGPWRRSWIAAAALISAGSVCALVALATRRGDSFMMPGAVGVYLAPLLFGSALCMVVRVFGIRASIRSHLEAGR